MARHMVARQPVRLLPGVEPDADRRGDRERHVRAGGNHEHCGGNHYLPLYYSSADTSNTSACGTPCSRVFEPLLTTGTPGIEGTLSGTIGSFTRTDGTTQVTYNGHPLYLYSDEGIVQVPGRGLTASGSGNGKTVGSGTFHLVSP